MSFDEYAKKGKVGGRGGANNVKRIKSSKNTELPKIDQGPKEPVDLLSLFKNVKWKKVDKSEYPEGLFDGTQDTHQHTHIINDEPMGKEYHTANMNAQLLKNNRSNLKRIPQTKESIEKPKFVAPKIQIYKPKPKTPNQKVTKPTNNVPLARAQFEFSKKNPKKLPPLKRNLNTYGSKASKMKSENQELLETQNEIARVQAELQFLANNPDYIPQTNEDEEELIETQRQIAMVQAELAFLDKHPDYVPETDENEEQPENNTPKVQSQSQAIIDTEIQIAKVEAELEFLQSHPDYIPDTIENEKPKKNEPNGPKKVESKTLKKIEPYNSQNTNKPKTQKNKDIEIKEMPKDNEIKSINMSKVPPISGQVTKIPKAVSKSEISPAEVDLEYEQFADSPETQKDLLALRATEKKISEMKVQLALMKKDPALIEQENLTKKDKPPKQPDNKAVVTSKNKVANIKSELELLQHNQDEPFEEYARRMKKRSRKKEPRTKLDTIIEEESEIVDESYEEEDLTENVTEAEDINEEEVDQSKWEEEYEEEEFEAAEEECEEADEEESKAADEECEETVEEEDEEIDEMIEEELEGDEATDFDEFGEEIKKLQEIEQNNKPQKSDANLNPPKKRNLTDILKKMNWIHSADGDEQETEELTESEEEESATECVEIDETLLEENTANEEGVETLQSDSLTKLDVKYDEFEIKPFDKMNTKSIPKVASKEDIFTSFFASKALKEEEMALVSEQSSLILQKFKEQILKSTRAAARKAQEVHTKSTSNVFEKPLLEDPDKASDDDSSSSFFDERPLVKSKNQNKPAETESDQSISESETKESKKPVDDKDIWTIKPALKDLQREPPIKYSLAQDKKDRMTLQELKRQPSSIKCNLEIDEEDRILLENLKLQPSTKEESKKPVDDKETIKTTLNDLQREPPIKYSLAQDKKDRMALQELKRQPSSIKCNLEIDKEDRILLENLKLQPSTTEESKKPVDDKETIKTTLNDLQREPPIKYSLAQDKKDRMALQELKRQPSSIKYNLEIDKEDRILLENLKLEPSTKEESKKPVDDKETIKTTLNDLQREPPIKYSLAQDKKDRMALQELKRQPSTIKCNLENDKEDEILLKDLKLQPSTKEESKKPVDDKDKELIKTTLNDLQREPPIKYSLAQDKKDRMALQELKGQPSSIKCNLEPDKEVGISSKDLKQQPSTIKCNLEKEDEISLKDLKLQPSTKEESKKPVDDKDKETIKTTLKDLQQEPPIKYSLAQDKKDRMALQELKRQPSSIKCNLERDKEDGILSINFKPQPSTKEESEKPVDDKGEIKTTLSNLQREPPIKYNLAQDKKDRMALQELKRQPSSIKCNLERDKEDGILSKDLKLQPSIKEESKKPVDDKDKETIKTTLNYLQREPPIKYNLAQDKKDKMALQELKRQPSSIKCNLKRDKEDGISSKDLKRQPSTIKCNLEKDDNDETSSNDLNELSASSPKNSNLEQNMETDKKDKKLVDVTKHKIIKVAPCQSIGNIIIHRAEVEFRDGNKPDHSHKPPKTTKPQCNSQYTEVRDFTSDSCNEKEESLKVESIHNISDGRIKKGKYDHLCHLYKVKIRIKSISWQGAGEMSPVTLSFYNSYTKERAPVKRKFILPYFYTKDFFCYVSYVSPPKMLDSSLTYYPPIIFITKRKSDTELARGVVNMNKERLQHKSNSFYTNMTLMYQGMIMGNAVLSIKVLDYGFLGEDVDDGTNEIIQIIFEEIKCKEMKIADHQDFVDKKARKKEKKVILDENSSSGDDTSSALPEGQLFKKRPFRYKRENKSDGSERSRKHTKSKKKKSRIATSSTSVQTDQIKKPKSFINNCKDIQTDIQEEDLDKPKSQTKMIQTDTEMDSKCPITKQGESKITQTEATDEQEIVNVGENKEPINHENVESHEEPIPDSVKVENEENLKNDSVSVKKPKKIKETKSKPSKPKKLKQVPVEEILPESEEELSKSEEVFSESEMIPMHLKPHRLVRPKTAKLLTLKAVQEQIDVRISRNKPKPYEPETITDVIEDDYSIQKTPRAIREYLDGKQLAEQFFHVCVERKPPPFDKMSHADLKKYKRKYVKKLRDALPSDFITPSSIRNKEIDSSERRWMSHMAAFLYNKKAMTTDESSSTVDKTDDQVSEMQSEVAPPDVLINNPDFNAMKKFYHPEYCQVDVMTSTADPYFEPRTHDCGAQTSERIIKQFTAQTREKTLQLLSKESKRIIKNAGLQTCLVVVDTIPPAQNGSEKLVNKNILYEKVCESEKLKEKKIREIKEINSIKTITLSKSNTQLESYPEQYSTSMIQEKDFVMNLQFELRDFLKNIRSEVHFLKHRAQYIQVPKHKLKSKSTDFDRLMKSFTSLVAHNEDRDFNVVYNELQQLQSLVFNTFKKYSEEPESRSRTKRIKNDNNYESRDKELKFIFKNPNVNKKAPKRKNRDRSFKTRSLPDIKSSTTLLYETDNSGSETAIPFYTKFRNRFFPFKKKQMVSDSESSLTPLGQKLSEKSTFMSPGLNTQYIEVEKTQMEAIKEKMINLQLKLRYYLEEREVVNNKNNKNNSGLEQMSQNILKLLHELRRLKSYVERVYKL